MFDECFEKLAELEGFESNVKGDPGGRTIWGISERFFPQDVEKMSKMNKEEAKKYAKEFYRKKFWVDRGEDKLNCVSFLMGVNVPGVVDKAIKNGEDYKGVLLDCLRHYLGLVDRKEELRKFFVGWVRRVVEVWKFTKGI